MTPISLAPLLQQFFFDRLIQQRHASPCTVAAYRDAFRLLLAFAERRLGKRPAALTLQDLSAPLLLAFLDHLERGRRNSIRTRNARLAALHAFWQYAGTQEPAALALAQRVLAIPVKRFERPLVGALSRAQIQAILDAPDLARWSGRRDQALFATLYNTGARISELLHLRVADVALDRRPAVVRLHGKGRKERQVPLWPTTARQLQRWRHELTAGPERPLFPNRVGGRLTRTAVAERLALAVRTAARTHPELAKLRITPHVVRHSLATHLLQAGVDITVIALWLGHESPATTHVYVEADLAMKERALRHLRAPHSRSGRYRPSDRVLAFLEGL
jgi:integrase/recombinase XerD